MQFDHKNYTNQSLLNVDITQTQIIGSCFCQVAPFTQVFKSDLVCEFINCNLDNVIIPSGCTLTNCCNNNILTIGDFDWIVDEKLQPIKKVGE